MTNQNYLNHVKKDFAYHYFAIPVSLLLAVASIFNLFYDFGLSAIILFLTLVVLHITIFLARDYAKKNQDRIIRLELRLRYYLLTSKPFDALESKLSKGQLVAIRFMEDKEFLEFLSSPSSSELDSDKIKKSIKQWKPDTMRV